MKDEGFVVTSIKIYKWQFELIKKKNLKLSTMVREWLTQYFKGSDKVSNLDRYFAELEEAKELIQKAEAKKQEIASLIPRLKEEAFKLLQAKFEEIELIFKEYSELIEEAKRKVQEVEQELKQLAEQEDKMKQEVEESELKELIEEVYKDALEHPMGVDAWVEKSIAGVNGIKVRFEKVLPNMAEKRGIKINLEKAKEIIEKYYPDIAKYLD